MNLQLNYISDDCYQSVSVTEAIKSSLINLDEKTFIDLEITSDLPLNTITDVLVVGNTAFRIEEVNFLNNQYYYKLNIDEIKSRLPGYNDAHISKGYYNTTSGNRKFYRLFINEIGIANIFMSTQNELITIGKINVQSSKIEESDYDLIVRYLMYNGYFGSNIFYKVVIEGQKDDLALSLLESLKELNKLLKNWHDSLQKFVAAPITKSSWKECVQSYNTLTNIDSGSLQWLIQNIDELSITDPLNSSAITIGMSKYKVDKILSDVVDENFDTYENRVIHGFIQKLISIFDDYFIIIERNSIDTKLNNFKDFLLNCFNRLIKIQLDECKNLIYSIKRHFENNLPVTKKQFEYPLHVQRFTRKRHYHNVLALMDFVRRNFSKGLTIINNFNIEIESFDKLFEVYIFYLIKDTISNFLQKQSTRIEAKSKNNSNKLSGKYEFITNWGLINLYYEDLPRNFFQFSSSTQRFNPDFVVEYIADDFRSYVIYDAKYKKYLNKDSENQELADLTLKYLHKIGLLDNKEKVVGLFSISLSTRNYLNSIFREPYGLNGKNQVTPQIGSIFINPKSFNIEKNEIERTLSLILNK